MPIVDIESQQGFGLAGRRIARNGQLTSGPNLALLSNYVNMIAARRFHVLAHAGNVIGTVVTGATIPGATRFHTSPNCGGVEVVMVLGRATSGTALGRVAWSLNGVLQASSYIGGSAGAATSGPSDLVVIRHRFLSGGVDLTGDTTYDAHIDVISNVALVSYTIYEVQRSSLDTAVHTSAPAPDVFTVGAPILDRDVAKLTDALWTIYRRQGPTQFTFADTESTLPSQTGTTWENILDGSSAGWSATAPGFWTIPYRKNRHTGTTLNVVFWAAAITNTGSGGRIRFVNSAGVLATITGFNTVASYIAVNATLDATISTSDLVIVEHSDSAGNTVTTIAAGCYEYLT